MAWRETLGHWIDAPINNIVHNSGTASQSVAAACGGSPIATTAWNRTNHEVPTVASGAFDAAFNSAPASKVRYQLGGILRNGYGSIRAVFDSEFAPGARTRDAIFEYDLAARLTFGGVAEHVFEYSYDARQNMTKRAMVKPGAAPVPDLLAGLVGVNYFSPLTTITFPR